MDYLSNMYVIYIYRLIIILLQMFKKSYFNFSSMLWLEIYPKIRV